MTVVDDGAGTAQHEAIASRNTWQPEGGKAEDTKAQTTQIEVPMRTGIGRAVLSSLLLTLVG
jgi:hypothetical protein